jgi:hypothetical protein
MKRTPYFLASLALAACIAGADAADDRQIKTESVEIRTFPDPQYGAVTLRGAASKDGLVEAISIEYKDKKIQVPADGLRDLHYAQIGTLSVTAAFSDPARPWLLLTLLSWDPQYMKIRGNPATVTFVIDNDEVVSRSISWMGESGASYRDTTKHFKRQVPK